MADKPAKDGADNKKQKIMIGVIIVIVLVVLWQVLGGTASTPTTLSQGGPGEAKGMSSGGPGGNKSGSVSGNNSAPAQMVSAAPTPDQPRQAPLPVNSELMKLQQQTQVDYIASINKLEMLKIQRDIDETKTAIAAAELSRMTAEKSIADLITSRENSGGGDMGPIGGQPNSPFGSPPPGGSATPAPALPAALPPVTHAAPPPVTFNVLSVTYQGHKWTAILAPESKPTAMVSVRVGDVLEDGSMVESISRDGVLVKHDNKTKKISIASSI